MEDLGKAMKKEAEKVGSDWKSEVGMRKAE